MILAKRNHSHDIVSGEEVIPLIWLSADRDEQLTLFIARPDRVIIEYGKLKTKWMHT